jgi:hypothetical protein
MEKVDWRIGAGYSSLKERCRECYLLLDASRTNKTLTLAQNRVCRSRPLPVAYLPGRLESIDRAR